MATIRLDKYLSVACGLSRNDAKLLLRGGRVAVDGGRVKKSDVKVDPLSSTVTVDGKMVEYKEHIYILMHKPAGILSACSDKRARTVLDIVPEHLKRDGLFPVGRLDKDTTGMLLITDDGDFAHRVISPKSHTDKLYYVELDGEIGESLVAQFEQGVTLADGTKCLPAKLEPAGSCSAYVTIREGKYHQIKRMFGTAGLGVERLHRVAIGGLRLPEDLKPGECVELTAQNLSLLSIF